MFQVRWLIVDGVLYVEHITYFKANFRYNTLPTVGLDLTVTYPVCLDGTYTYKFTGNIPIREKFTFQEAWNIDFIGADIEYTDCLKEGNTITTSADVITTDIDPIYLDNEASNDGFVMFHCDPPVTLIGVTSNVYQVAVSRGELSNLEYPNAHLSWANLHQYYWVYNRPLKTGKMNNRVTNFLYPYIRFKKQIPIEFPFCVENFDDKDLPKEERMSNSLVRTTMGDGEIDSVEYTFKTGNMKIELLYDED